ncbi:YheT family hydrolase [Chitinibacteraceae bacterium HSL-7]
MQREHRLDLPPYRAPRWLPGGHTQTVYPATLMWQKPLHYRRESWVTPDLDTIVADWIDGRAGTPIVVLFHGLEGSSGSHYARALFRYIYPRGWRGVVPHFRTCGNVSNRLPRSYHAGDSEEIDWILRRLRERFPDVPIYAAGVSLGGNALLKWLGQTGFAARQVISAAASVCAPVDLAACGNALDRGVNRVIYTREFLRTMRRKTLDKFKLDTNPFISKAAIKGIRTLRDFDHQITAPLHGFHGVEHYWKEASSKPWLASIQVPTLMIHAENDPFIPVSSLPEKHEVSDNVMMVRTAEGGHVGFVSGPPPGQLLWLPNVLLRFFQHHAPRRG